MVTFDITFAENSVELLKIEYTNFTVQVPVFN